MFGSLQPQAPDHTYGLLKQLQTHKLPHRLFKQDGILTGVPAEPALVTTVVVPELVLVGVPTCVCVPPAHAT